MLVTVLETKPKVIKKLILQSLSELLTLDMNAADRYVAQYCK